MIRTIAAVSLCIASTYAAIDIITPAIGDLSPSFDGTTFDNCIQITPTYNFHWSIVGNDLCVAHEGFSADDVYFGFAVVADPNAPNRMAAADTVLTMFDNNQASAIDFFMNAVQECDVDNGMGVCPDELIQPAGNNDVVDVTGFNQEGIHAVGYSRPLAGPDGITDRDVDIANDATYIFAIGPRRGDGLPMYHMANRGAAVVNLGRTPSFDCVQLDPAQLTMAPTPAPTPAPTNAPTPTMVDGDVNGASSAKPEYLLAALVLVAALL